MWDKRSTSGRRAGDRVERPVFRRTAVCTLMMLGVGIYAPRLEAQSDVPQCSDGTAWAVRAGQRTGFDTVLEGGETSVTATLRRNHGEDGQCKLCVYPRVSRSLQNWDRDERVSDADIEPVIGDCIELVFDDDENKADYLVGAVEDDACEGPEWVEFHANIGGSITSVQSGLVVVRDDPYDMATVGVEAAEADEGRSLDFDALRVPACAAVDAAEFEEEKAFLRGYAFDSTYQTEDGTAVAGEDYSDTSGSVTVAVGDATGTISVATVDDRVSEPDETLTVRLGTGASATGTIRDDDEPPTVRLEASPEVVTEGAGRTPVTITARLDGNVRSVATTVTLTVTGSGEAGVVEFTPVSGFTITIDAGETNATGTFDLVPQNDDVDENDEALAITGEADVAVEGTEVALTDDDESSTEIALAAEPAQWREDAGSTAVEVTAMLDASARTEASTVTVTVSASGEPQTVGFDPIPQFAITIGAGAKSGVGTFDLILNDNDLDDADETLTVSGESDLAVTGASVTLVDDDEPSTVITLAASPSRVVEGQGAVAVEVTATFDAAGRTMPTEVAVTVEGSGVTQAVDFAPVPSFTITIAAATRSGTGMFTLQPEDDLTDESDETLTVSGTAVLPVAATSVELADDDETSGSIRLVAAPASVVEGGGASEVVVRATMDGGARLVDTTVMVSVAGSGQADAVDFAAVPDFTVTITAGAISGSASFRVTPENDGVDEMDEVLTITGVSDLPVTSTSVTLVDDDEGSNVVILSTDPAVLSEGDGPTPIQVSARLDASSRTDATLITLTVVASGDPRAVDYAPVSSFEITIPAEHAVGRATFTLTPEDDGLVETDQTLTLRGSASGLAVRDAVLRITDDDTASTRIRLSAVPDVVSEGSGSTSVQVRASLNGSVREESTTVMVEVSDGGDPAAVDFEPVPDFEIEIAAYAGSGTGTFELTPDNDTVDETDGTLMVAGKSELPVTPAAITLLDDDESTRIRLGVVPSRVSEDAGSTTVEVTATLDASRSETATTVTVSVTGSGDPGAVDFEPVADFEIVIPLGMSSGAGSFSLVAENDLLGEDDETLTLSGMSDLPVTPAVLKLIDDDERSSRIQLTVDPSEVTERDGPTAIAVTATLDRGQRQVATPIRISVTGSGDPAAVDFAAVAGFSLTIPAHAASATGGFTLTPEDDQQDEADETVTVTGVSDLTVVAASIDIRDDEALPTISVGDGRAPESARELAFPVVLDIASAVDVTVGYATVDSGGMSPATAPEDYTATSGTSVIAAGEVSGTIRVTVVDDGLDEPDETFALVLSNPQGGMLARTSALGTIEDDDAAPSLSVADSAAAEDAGELTFAVTLDTPSARTVSARYATSDGTALAEDDYLAASGTLTVAPGDTSTTVQVRVVDDDLYEADEESLTLTLSSVVNAALADGMATGTIRDNDLAPPSLASELPAASLCVGGAAFKVDLGDYFAGEEVEFSSTLSAPGVVAMVLSGSRLTLTPLSEGEATVTVRASNAKGAVESTVAVLVVADPAELTEIDSVLASVGRGMLADVTDSVAERFGPAFARGDPAVTPGTWSAWLRRGTRRFEAQTGGGNHDGALMGIHIGADIRGADWLAGISLLRSEAEADYRFMRSSDACGGNGTGSGIVDAKVSSVYPYGGRRMGNGWVWAAVGVGDGKVSVERCEPGHVSVVDLSVRLFVAGGRHEFASRDRLAWSVVEDLGVLALTTGASTGPAGDRSVNGGRARLGIEVAVDALGEGSGLTVWTRAFARSDWGDGATGAGLELAAGLRYRHPPRRIGVDAAVRALAVHSEDLGEHAVDLALSLLPRPDGKGLQATVAWRRDTAPFGWAGTGGVVPWNIAASGRPAPVAGLRAAQGDRTVGTRISFGITPRWVRWGHRGLVTPFVELDDRVRFGVRHEFNDMARDLVAEWSVERHGAGYPARRVALTVVGRF